MASPEVGIKLKHVGKEEFENEFKQMLTRLSVSMSEAMGEVAKSTEHAYATASEHAERFTKAATEGSQRVSKQRKEDALSAEEVEEKSNAAVAESSLKYAKLKTEYEGRSLDDVRAKIMQFEEETRVLRRARSNEDEAAVKKNLQTRINAVNTELQLYRSLEKDKTGRTFSEQMERLKLAEKSDKELQTILKNQTKEFESLQRQMTATQNAEEKKRLDVAIKDIKAEEAAVKQEQHVRAESATGITKIKNLAHEATGGAQGLTSSLSSMGSAVPGMSGVSSVLSSMGPYGMAAAAGVAVLTAGIGKSIEVGAKFEETMAGIQAVSGVNKETLDKLGHSARELAVQFGTGASDSAESFKLIMDALGADIAKQPEQLASMSKSVMVLAQATGTDAKDAASALTTTLMQFGGATLNATQQAEQTTRIMNVMAAGAKAGAAEVPELSEAIKVVGTVSAQSKVSVEQTTAAIEIMSQQGIHGAEAGTGLRNVLLDLSSGSKKAKTALADMGLTYDQVNPEKVGLSKSLAVMKAHLSGVTDAVKRAEIMQHLFGKENIASANILIKNSDALDTMTASVTGTSEATDQAKIRSETFSAGMKRMGAIIEEVALSVYGFIAPALSAIMDFAEPILHFFGEAFPIALKIVFAPLKLLFGIIKTIFHWVGLLVGAFVKWVTHLGFVQTAMHAVKTAITSVVDWIMKAYNAVKDFINTVGNVVEKFLGGKKTVVVPVKVEPTVDPLTVAKDVEAPDEEEAGAGAGKAGKAPKAAAEKKDPYQEAKDAREKAFKDEQADIKKSVADKKITAEEGARQTLAAQQKHDEDMLALAVKFKDDTHELELKISEDKAAARKVTFEKALKDVKDNTEKSIAELEIRGVKEGLSQKQLADQKAVITRAGMDAEIKIRKDAGEDTSKLELQLAAFDIKIRDEVAKHRKTIAAEIAKADADIRKQNLADLKASGADALQIAKEEASNASQDENARYKDELEKRKDDLADVKMGHLLKQSMEQDHQNKMLAIQMKAIKAEQAERMQSLAIVTGPMVQQYQGAFQKITGFVQGATDKWISQKTVVGQVVQSLSASLIKYVEDWIAKKAVMFATSLLFHGQEAAAATASAAAMSAAYATPAALASVASFGAADAAGSAGLTAAIAGAKALSLIGFKQGGWTGGGGESDVAGFVHGQEYVITAPGARKAGTEYLDSINRGRVPLTGEDMVRHTEALLNALHDVKHAAASKPAPTIMDQQRNVLSLHQAEVHMNQKL